MRQQNSNRQKGERERERKRAREREHVNQQQGIASERGERLRERISYEHVYTGIQRRKKERENS